jgi:YidC/Oxa1 family membrane protein insertase
MNFDRNTIFGFIALAILFFGYFYFTSRDSKIAQQAALREKAVKDSIDAIKKTKTDPTVAYRDSLAADSMAKAGGAIAIAGDTALKEKRDTLENKIMRVVFSNKGGQPEMVELKNFKAPDSNNVKLAATPFDKLGYEIKSGTGTADISNALFTSNGIKKSADGTQTISYTLQSPQGPLVTHEFVLKPEDYMMDFNLAVAKPSELLSNNTVNFNWQYEAVQLQRDLTYEKQQSFIAYNIDGNYDDKSIFKTSKEFDKPVRWISVKQQFFNTTFLAKNNFSSGSMEWVTPDSAVVRATAHMKLKLADNGTANMAFYYGPTDYRVLKKYGNDMENMVNLGSGVFAFVKYINRWIILPVWELFKKITLNYGIVILLLTLFIRLLTSPLMYPSYLTSAKMRILRPELEELKKKYPDQQQFAMEQMKFTREAGVNQFAGCLPGLLQIPIFFALYSFFNSNVDLRGQPFLWAKDLSQYDTIVHFGFNIPLLGDHLSLFTITAVITSFFISLYSMSSAPNQDNPVLKYMPYFFPIIMLFIFNKLPAALTWYYTVSNIITLAIQFVIQNYIIDHDKVIAKIEANRKKPKTKSKWQERMEQMQEQQKKMQEQRKK